MSSSPRSRSRSCWRRAGPRPAARSPDQDRRGLVAAERVGDRADGVVGDGRAGGGRQRIGDLPAVAPRDVGGKDQSGDLAGRVGRGGDRGRGIRPDLGGVVAAPHPTVQRLGDRLDVRLEGGVVLLVVSRVVADDVHDRGEGTARVVQARHGVAEPRAEMQEGGGWLLGDPAVAVGGAGDDAFEQPEHSAHLWNLVERRDEVHLGGPGIRKHTSTPEPTRLLIRDCAPFIVSPSSSVSRADQESSSRTRELIGPGSVCPGGSCRLTPGRPWRSPCRRLRSRFGRHRTSCRAIRCSHPPPPVRG